MKCFLIWEMGHEGQEEGLVSTHYLVPHLGLCGPWHQGPCHVVLLLSQCEYSLLDGMMVLLACVSLERLWCGFTLQSGLFISHVLSISLNPQKVSEGPVLLQLHHIPENPSQSSLAIYVITLVHFPRDWTQFSLLLLLLWCQFSFLKEFSCFLPDSFHKVDFIFTRLWAFGVPCEPYSLAQTGVWRKPDQETQPPPANAFLFVITTIVA